MNKEEWNKEIESVASENNWSSDYTLESAKYLEEKLKLKGFVAFIEKFRNERETLDGLSDMLQEIMETE